MYQYSQLDQDEVLSEGEGDGRYDPRPRGLRRYRDVPDDEVSAWYSMISKISYTFTAFSESSLCFT